MEGSKNSGRRDHVMALPAWGGFPGFRVLEVVEQNLAGSTPFFPPLEGTGKEEGCPRGTHRFNPFGFGFNLCGRRHVQR